MIAKTIMVMMTLLMMMMMMMVMVMVMVAVTLGRGCQLNFEPLSLFRAVRTEEAIEVRV